MEVQRIRNERERTVASIETSQSQAKDRDLAKREKILVRSKDRILLSAEKEVKELVLNTSKCGT